MPMPRRFLAAATGAALALLLAACSGGSPDGASADDGMAADTMPADSITKRQRDSAIGASGLPGAQGVRGALDAADAAAERAAAIDSVTGGR